MGGMKAALPPKQGVYWAVAFDQRSSVHLVRVEATPVVIENGRGML